jgi:CMP-N,N'-diacetyllegionaminic acid synthase
LRYLCIIPARCNSKSIPFKNIVDLCNKPLIAYTIENVLELKMKKLISDFIISTDCKEIADVAKNYGAEVPFLRPKKIAEDKAKSVDYVLNSINYYEERGIKFDAVLILQPTSPLKSFEDIKKSIEIFNKNDKDSLISAYREDTINKLIMYRKENDVAIPLNNEHNKGIRRQDYGSVYIRNGAIYITNVEYLKKEKKIISDIPLIYEMSKKRSINIDTYEDLELVRNLLCK